MRVACKICLVFWLALATILPAWSTDWRGKVAGSVIDRANQGNASFLLILRDQADLSGAKRLMGKKTKGQWVVDRLRSLARRSQAPILEELTQLKAPHQSFWVTNMIVVEGDLDLVANLAQREDVARIAANAPFRSEIPLAEKTSFSGTQISWGVDQINAPAVWAMGYTGQGVVVAGQDTGYDWDHPGLIEQYRGWNGISADHNYNWHDAIHTGGGSCGPDAAFPCDDGSHGTHTLGTMVGNDGLGNQVGVAPGATWIGCRNMDEGNGTPATYSECFQWFLAPTDLNGENPDVSKAPHVINNSWGCPAVEGCTDPEVMRTLVENVRAAGIVVVASAGNSGSGCATINTPSAIYDASFTVGATGMTDAIASLSSRGPVTIDGSNRLKPDIVAPGLSIRSTIPNGNYGNKSGTSMAGPHVAGLVALILSAAPELEGDVDRIEEIIRNTALPLTSTQDCGAFPGDQVPNPVYGWGRIRADVAVEEALGIRQPECGDFPGMVALWPMPVNGFPDTNGNHRMDVIDLIPVSQCSLAP